MITLKILNKYINYFAESSLIVKFSLFILSISLLLFVPKDIFAHKLNIIPWFQGNVLHVEAKFNDGKEISNGNIEIFNGNGKLITNGRTNPKGHFSFQVKEIDNIRIVLSTSCGHKGFLKIPRNKIRDMINPVSSYNKYEDLDSEKLIVQPETQHFILEQIEFIISQQLDNKLEPISKAIAYGQIKKHGIYDILSGIGYILGLIGLVTYIRYGKT